MFSRLLAFCPRTKFRGSCSDKVGAIPTNQGWSVMFSQPYPGGCTPTISLDSFFQLLHPVACRLGGQGVLCFLGYLFLSKPVGITCSDAPLGCTMDRTHHIPPLAWAVYTFCRWAHQLASQLFHMWYFPISPLFYTWPGSLFSTARCGHPAPVRCSHTIVLMFGLSFLYFLGQIKGPIQFVLQLAYIVMVCPLELFLCFLIQTGD